MSDDVPRYDTSRTMFDLANAASKVSLIVVPEDAFIRERLRAEHAEAQLAAQQPVIDAARAVVDAKTPADALSAYADLTEAFADRDPETFDEWDYKKASVPDE